MTTTKTQAECTHPATYDRSPPVCTTCGYVFEPKKCDACGEREAVYDLGCLNGELCSECCAEWEASNDER